MKTMAGKKGEDCATMGLTQDISTIVGVIDQLCTLNVLKFKNTIMYQL